jgi:hypothetical protein
MAASPIASTNPPARQKVPPNPSSHLRDLHKRFGKQEILVASTSALSRRDALHHRPQRRGQDGDDEAHHRPHPTGFRRCRVAGMNVNAWANARWPRCARRSACCSKTPRSLTASPWSENVAFPLREAAYATKPRSKQRVLEALELVDLAEHWTNTAHQPLRRHAQAHRHRPRHHLPQPECILYDEPTSGLDPIVSDVIDRMILRLQKRFTASPASSSPMTCAASSRSPTASPCSKTASSTFSARPTNSAHSPDPDRPGLHQRPADVTG